jgi:hypothetical protein
MATLKELHQHWETDAPLNKTELDEESRNIPMLHARWMRFYTDERRVFTKLKNDLAALEHRKTEYYLGRLDDDTIKELGWPVNPLKLLRDDAKRFVGADPEVLKIREQFELQETKLKFLEDVIRSINGRGYLIKNMIDFLNFTKGY